MRIKCTASEYVGIIQKQFMTALTKKTLKAGFCPCKFTLAQHILSKYGGLVYVMDFLLHGLSCEIYNPDSDYNKFIVKLDRLRETLNIHEVPQCLSSTDELLRALIHYVEYTFANVLDYTQLVLRHGISLPVTTLIGILNNYIIGNMILDIKKNLPDIVENPCKGFELITDYTENFILALTGIRLKCDRIHLDRVDDKIIQCISNAAEKLGYSLDYLIDHYNCREYCSMHQKLHSEKLILYVVPELAYNGYLSALLHLVSTCHENPKDIELIIDYRFVKDYTWNDRIYRKFQRAKQCFKNVLFVNYENVDFNGYYEEIKDHLIHDYDPVALFDMDIDVKLLNSIVSDYEQQHMSLNCSTECKGCTDATIAATS